MTSALTQLYQEVILDHNKHPRNFYLMQNATTNAEGFNPICGDKINIFLQIKDDVINKVSFQGCGCAISQASASLMTDMLEGKSIEDAENLFNAFHGMMVENGPVAPLGKLAVLANVRRYPARVKCATLAWHTFEAALHKSKATVSTEGETDATF
ncbi:MAG: SUF system NifU family Fe-S cluster assembly protein [Legionellales bacterium RIFCSPHIGHO2_12_FULL_37_14]|nr:MAG: SUF system NifU family Fe-S cluster assembly protein [Legionellales bacterium RIFCSPHIGHO2_12_FULL_37_14]